MCNVRFYALEICGIWAHLVRLLPVMVGKLVYIPMFLLFEQGSTVINKKEYVTSDLWQNIIFIVYDVWGLNASFMFFHFPD